MVATAQLANAADGLAHRFDPFSAAYVADPYPTLRHVREAAPVFYSPTLDHWIVTRHADVRWVLRTSASFSAVNAIEPFSKLCPHATKTLKEGGYAAVPALTNMDPPRHSQQRRLASAAFTPKRVAELEPFIRESVQRFCDERFNDGHADIIGDLAWELPALVLFRVLSLPDSDIARVKQGALYRDVVLYGQATEDEQVKAARELASFWQYAGSLVDARS